MYRSTGWRFLEIGRDLERAWAMAGLLAALTEPGAPEGALDLAVEIGDSVMSNRRRYSVATSRTTVLDLLALDAKNPRAILFHLDALRCQIGLLPGAGVPGQLSPLARAALKAQTDLAVQTPETLDTDALLATAGALAGLSDLLTDTYLR